ncbi:hypothetical protein CANARDRAFT_5562 [[Candida] arabinofermentans NRRL YB-2248]|uniref:Uncharacterized protein n=1 Tax=[Candida] arabinofermentans NRRL YB-2248 TaxID=983967 RepID=A0A1E4T9D5_9ASCO|nr:hypothetical protein CANARDRAFT_5562 [[Candida] arabinofermentans NRRL YB-2248]
MSVGESPMPFPEARDHIVGMQTQNLYRAKEVMDRYDAQKIRLKSAGIDPITNIIVNELFWMPKDTPLNTSSQDILNNQLKYADERPFANTDDIVITKNTFPYFIENSESLCVWVKFPLPPDPASEVGDISDEHKALIEKYIQSTFVEWLGVPRENIAWFKNWAALQSIKSLAHVHVILNGADEATINKALGTGGVAIEY